MTYFFIFHKFYPCFFSVHIVCIWDHLSATLRMHRSHSCCSNNWNILLKRHRYSNQSSFIYNLIRFISSTQSTFTSPWEDYNLNNGIIYRHNIFTNEFLISSATKPIPIFRVLGYDGQIQGNWKCPFTKEECIERYKFMVRVSIWDQMLFSMQRQGNHVN